MLSVVAGGDRYRHLTLLGQNIPEAGLLLSPGDRLHRVQGGRGGRLPHRGAPHPRQAVHQEGLESRNFRSNLLWKQVQILNIDIFMLVL